MAIQKTKIQSQKTRSLIQQQLKQKGELSAAVLAEGMGLTAMAIRQHLYDMEAEGLIAATSIKSGKGRPTKKWHLTEKANHLFADSHSSLTVELINAVRKTFGEEGLNKIIRERSKDQIAVYSAVIADVNELEKRLALLAQRRTEEGYMAAVANDGDGFLFIENHCPICEAARECSGLCASELDVFRSSLGPEVSVERQDHILLGARRCVYSVKLIPS